MSVLEGPTRELLNLLAQRDISPSEVIDQLEDRISSLPKDLNPFVTVDLDRARESARQLEGISPGQRGPLYGLPLPVKDLERTADLDTSFGIPFRLPGGRPTSDGSFAARARASGAILYAKSNTSAFGHKDVTENLVAGVTTNPWDRTRTPGGSSGGAAAIVAAGLGPVAHGTDAGGSVRFPASFCGLVGFKPSFGRLPRVPSPDLWAARGHHGFLGLSVDDMAVMMDALSGHDLRDPLAPPDHWRSLPVTDNPRVVYVPSMFGQDVDVAVQRVLDSSITAIEDSGIHVERRRIVWGDPIPDAQAPMAAREWYLLRKFAAERPELLEKSHLELIDAGAAVTTEELIRAQEGRSALYTRTAQLFEDVDFLLTPTMPLTAWRWDDEHPHINGTPLAQGPGTRWPDILLANIMGWPAISVPCGWIDGLPVGLHIMARGYRDAACLHFAARIEEILGFKRGPLPDWNDNRKGKKNENHSTCSQD